MYYNGPKREMNDVDAVGSVTTRSGLATTAHGFFSVPFFDLIVARVGINKTLFSRPWRRRFTCNTQTDTNVVVVSVKLLWQQRPPRRRCYSSCVCICIRRGVVAAKFGIARSVLLAGTKVPRPVYYYVDSPITQKGRRKNFKRPRNPW